MGWHPGTLRNGEVRMHVDEVNKLLTDVSGQIIEHLTGEKAYLSASIIPQGTGLLFTVAWANGREQTDE